MASFSASRLFSDIGTNSSIRFSDNSNNLLQSSLLI
jgi:hypothetical protein